MINMGNLMINSEKKSLDFIMIVDKDFNIIFNTRCDNRVNSTEKEMGLDIINKNFFLVYPSICKEDSSIFACMKTGEVIIKKNQQYTDCEGNNLATNNVTVPIKSFGKITGVVELSQSVVDFENIDIQNRDFEFDEFVEKIIKDAEETDFGAILTRNKEMLNNIEKAKILAKISNPVLIYGETGTGKELFAQAMIKHSKIPENKAIVQNCAAVPDGLMESILFGTEKGAYTGAEHTKGLFEEADGGVLFLDELNSMPYYVQAKLLRVLQDGSFRSLGGSKDKKVSVKVIGAINIDPIVAMEKNIIRKDLFYRFSSGLITLLPLRERKEDISLYLDHYILYYASMYNKKIDGVSKKLRKIFTDYSWEGNVRELKNVVESMVSYSKEEGILDIENIPDYLSQRLNLSEFNEEDELQNNSVLYNSKYDDGKIPLKKILDDMERKLIFDALNKTNGNQSKAAELLELPRETLKYKMVKMNIK